MTTVRKLLIILGSRLTRADQRSKHGNPHRLAHYLGGVQQVQADCVKVLDKGDTAAMEQLLSALDSRFVDLAPVDKLAREIREYIATGKEVKL